ncbi:hypothetical protein [Sinorhizobium sp. M4_45]|uniref:hypothetical protein n=1 Tax=Sinorhizobium sp. M4_45 TaxID=2037901 RepID=UPI000C9C72A2|nr:hypothetical protein [Sinorhizobium sp. M4_45]PND27040.1 hypothetical protein CN933_15130 [Sinorhizobium sp. M4_45]
MANLTSKLESFIQMMQQGDEFARHGFDLLTKRPEPEQYFDALNEAGLFNPSHSSGPVPSNEPGFVQIPFWTALNYLGAVAKRAGELNNNQLADKVLDVIRDVTNFRDQNGEPRDNYHTYHQFADILGVLPVSAITKKDIQLATVWLSSRFDHGLVGRALCNGLLKRLLASGGSEDVEKACLLMKECMAFRWLPEEGRRGRDLVTNIDDYWLKEIVDNFAKVLGAKAEVTAVKIFEDGLRAIFADSRRSYGSTLWRPAIEDNYQNLTFRGPENRFVDGMRDALAGWTETRPDEAAEYVKSALKDEVEIVRRIAIHTVAEYFELLREPFEAIIEADLFTSAHRHELYRLLKERFAALSQSGKEKIITALQSLRKPESGDDPDRRVKFTQREWLTAVKDHPEAAGWFAELSSDYSLGSPTDHPEFLSYHEMRVGPGPTPFAEESLTAFAEDGTIVDRLNEFKEKDSWKGPTLGGLVAALEAAVAASPNTFLPLLSDFHRAKIPFQHALVSGFKRVFDGSKNERSTLDWSAAWPKLMTFFSQCLNDDVFWSSKAAENVDLVPTRAWMQTSIADFLESGTKNDENAYPPELLPQGWELIKILLERAALEIASPTDPMTHALNTEKGRAIGAMYNHALRVCRLAQQNSHPLEEAWATLKPVFDAEIAKCCNANFEFSTLSASYIANIDYMSHEWLQTNLKRLFPTEYPANFQAALGGLAYATPTRMVYRLVASNGILDNAFKAKLEDSYSQKRLIEWICLAYLWGDETLDSTLMERIFEGGVDDLQNAVGFFEALLGEKLTSEQNERVLAFWAKCLEWAQAQPEAHADLLAGLGRLAPYVTALDARAKGLLLGVVPYVHSGYSTDQMIEEFARLVDTNPASTIELLERMFDASTPHYDMDNKLRNLLHKLAGMGYRTEVLHCIEKLRKTLPGMVEFYKQIVGR